MPAPSAGPVSPAPDEEVVPPFFGEDEPEEPDFAQDDEEEEQPVVTSKFGELKFGSAFKIPHNDKQPKFK